MVYVVDDRRGGFAGTKAGQKPIRAAPHTQLKPLRCSLLLVYQIGDLKAQGQVGLKVGWVAGIPCAARQVLSTTLACLNLSGYAGKGVRMNLLSWDSAGSVAWPKRSLATILDDAYSRLAWDLVFECLATKSATIGWGDSNGDDGGLKGWRGGEMVT